VIPSGAIEVCGNRPRRRAISLAWYEAMSDPSRTTRPVPGLSSRARARRRVDFPHAFGPTITVNDSSGIDTERFSEMTRRS
jgi:hypothetical protein